MLPYSLRGLASLIEFIITITFPSSEMKQERSHEAMCFCYANVTAESAAYNNIEARVYNTLYDGIILQKRFVKELYCRNAL
jgi:hypothetical protein